MWGGGKDRCTGKDVCNCSAERKLGGTRQADRGRVQRTSESRKPALGGGRLRKEAGDSRETEDCGKASLCASGRERSCSQNVAGLPSLSPRWQARHGAGKGTGRGVAGRSGPPDEPHRPPALTSGVARPCADFPFPVSQTLPGCLWAGVPSVVMGLCTEPSTTEDGSVPPR